MFLEIPGLPFKRHRFYKHCFTDAPLAEGKYGGERPKHLVPLGQAGWPAEVVNKIVELFKAIDLQDPERQKLVEPYAVVFGGRCDDGMSDLSKVNWEKVVDYFTWEAAEHGEDVELADKLQGEARKKYGGIFMHYPVYENYRNRG